MRHLFSSSVFEEYTDMPGAGDAAARLAAHRLDGFELFTLFDPVPAKYAVKETVGVHLPYALDWYSAWEGRSYPGAEDQDIRYLAYGCNRDGMATNLRQAFLYASRLFPAYGVLHAGNTDLRTMMERRPPVVEPIIRDFAELLNRTVAGFAGGEPPLRLVFENLWWDGLRLRSPAEWRILEEKLEFQNWGLCLDTGHLMNTCDEAYDEESAIDSVLRIIDGYPTDMLFRLRNMHLQLSTSAAYRRSFVSAPRAADESFGDYMTRAYAHAGHIDQHRPFTSLRAKEIVDAVRPDYLIHELMGGLSGDRYADLDRQRALFF